MNRLSQKCQYALRAVLELAKRRHQGPVAVRDISEQQAIPYRFLELIVRDLRRERIVESYRGAHGGYKLIPDPEILTVGRIIRIIDGPIIMADCTSCGGKRECPLIDDCRLIDFWREASDYIMAFYDSKTIAQLLSPSEETSQS